MISFGTLIEQVAAEHANLQVIKPPQGDLKVILADHEDEPEEITTLKTAHRSSAHQHSHELQLALSSLKGYQYIQEAERRRSILSELYTVLSPSTGVIWAEALGVVCQRAEISRSQASKYHAILLQSQAFQAVDPQDDRPVKHRRLKLIESLSSSQALTKRYEQSIIHKVMSRRGEVSFEVISDLLGLTPHENADEIHHLISAARAEIT